MKTHKQCCLTNIWCEEYVCWLPSKFAVEGKVLEIEGKDLGKGAAGEQLYWKVNKVYNELPTAVVLERSQDYKRTRKASDI